MKHTSKLKRIADKRYLKSLKPKTKRRRLELKNARSQLKRKLEYAEGVTYQSNSQLLTKELPIIISEVRLKIDSNSQPIVVFFDLETSGFYRTDEILQIAAKYENKECNQYVKPKKAIGPDASTINSLTFEKGNLLYKNNVVESDYLPDAMLNFFNFLVSLGKMCVLAAHNCSFARSVLNNAIKKTCMQEHY